MTQFFTLALLGLCTGSMIAMSAHGIVLIYRGSGVLNLAHAALGSLAAFVYWNLHDSGGVPFGLAMAAAVGCSACCGLAMHYLVLNRMRRASPMTKLVGTLAVLVIVQSALQLHYGSGERRSNPILPTTQRDIFGLRVGEDRLILLGISVVLTLVLHLVYSRTRFGIATAATAENRRAAAALGLSAGLIAALNWLIGAALAGLAAVLLAPVVQVQLVTQSALLVPVLAAALFGGMRSFGLTFLGGAIIGISQVLVGRYVQTLGWSDAVPFLLIAVVMTVRARGIAGRPQTQEVRPGIGTGRIRPWAAIGFCAAVVVIIQWAANPTYLDAITLTECVGLILLSSVVVTGYAGQLSLCQFAIAGIGAVIAGLLVIKASVPFFLALVCGVLASFVVGVIIGLPALRARGINLALATLGLGAAVQSVLLLNPNYTGGSFATVPDPHLFGLDLNAFVHPKAYATFCFVFLIAAALAVANLRRGAAGRRLIAVRANERAAAAQGINVFAAKLYAFAIAAAIAGAGGILLTFRQTSLSFTQFAPDSSIDGVLYAVVGGIGYIFGPILGSLGEPAGIVQTLFGSQSETFDLWLALIVGVMTVPLLQRAPDGLLITARNDLVRLLRAARVLRIREPSPPSRLPDRTERGTQEAVPPRSLHVRGLSVSFGGVAALIDFDCDAEPGKILGIIGPNGAGKTTMIEAVTGFVRPKSGAVELDGTRINKWKPHRRVHAGVGRTFQSLELFDDMTVAENLKAATDARQRFAYAADLVWPRRKGLPNVAIAAVQEFHLEHDLDKYPGELSYGSRRLVAIARSLAASPSVLCLDEPAAGLSAVERRELASLLRKLATEWRIALILVEHDVELVMSTCDEIVAIQFGRTIARGTPEQVRRNPAVIEAYLGAADSDDGSEGPVVDVRDEPVAADAEFTLSDGAS